MELERIIKQVMRGKKIEDAAGKFDWRGFERSIGDAFRYNDFAVRNNVRFKFKNRYEIDVVAERGDLVFCVDCKRWSEGRDKTWGILKAAGEQEWRTNEFRKFSESNLKRPMGKLEKKKYVPMLVTLHQENVTQEGNTFIVPIGKLNTFIVSCEAIV